MKSVTITWLSFLLISALFFQVGGEPVVTQTVGTTTRVSLASDGSQGDWDSSTPSSISADGRYVAFVSSASNLVSGDTNTCGITTTPGNCPDIFIHDRQTDQTTRVSIASDGTQANGGSFGNSITADGRYVAFDSSATNLVNGDTNDNQDIFVHDQQTGQTTLVSISTGGIQGNGYSAYPSISADGRYVAFESAATNLVNDDTNRSGDIFVHDRQTGQTTRVSVASDGAQGYWGGSGSASISADGRYVAFASSATNLVSGDTNDNQDIFVHDQQTGQTTLVSISTGGIQGNGYSDWPSISANGRYVAFVSLASNLIPADINGVPDIFVYDQQTEQATRVSVASDGTQGNGSSTWTSISSDGRYVVFASYANNLVSGDTNGVSDIFVHDRQTRQTTRISVASNGAQGNGDSWSWGTAISQDARYVVFASRASNLVSTDTNGWMDVFVRDRGTWDITYTISGRVTDGSNSSVSDVTISDGVGHAATTDSNGNYTLSGLVTGTYILTSSKNSYTFSPPSRAVSVPPNKIGYDFVAILPPPQTCTVPFFSQRDNRWMTHTLGTNGACSSQCNTIGACGCTLTSAAMVFSYYGANLNPPILSDCMGMSACPFDWGIGASCTKGKAAFIGRYEFSWSRLDQELNQNHRPVILGMHRKGHPNDTHWVVVISGKGSDPADYTINDPWFLGGANMKLSARTLSYDLDSLSVYNGQPSCSGTPSIAIPSSVMPRVTLPASFSVVTGTALIYKMTETTMTVQLVAQSSAGNITEMLVWTDEITNPTWEPFSTLIELPLSDHVYARFRDEYGNESEPSSDTIYPINTPVGQLPNIFLPMILK